MIHLLTLATLLPQEEHPLIHPKQVHRNYHRQQFLHTRHSATIIHGKKVGSEG